MTRTEQAKQDRADSRRAKLIYAGLAVILALAAVLVAAVWWLADQNRQQSVQADAREHRLEQVEKDSKDLSGALTDQRKQFEECKNKKAKDHPECSAPVADSPKEIVSGSGTGSIKTITGKRGPRGARGATGRDGADSNVPGPQGVPGAASTERGVPGKDGADSQVPGPRGEQGRPGADSTVPGPRGEAGQDGRGISSIVCDPSGDWIATYTDNSKDVVSGPCRVDDSSGSDDTSTPDPAGR